MKQNGYNIVQELLNPTPLKLKLKKSMWRASGPSKMTDLKLLRRIAPANKSRSLLRSMV